MLDSTPSLDLTIMLILSSQLYSLQGSPYQFQECNWKFEIKYLQEDKDLTLYKYYTHQYLHPETFNESTSLDFSLNSSLRNQEISDLKVFFELRIQCENVDSSNTLSKTLFNDGSEPTLILEYEYLNKAGKDHGPLYMELVGSPIPTYVEDKGIRSEIISQIKWRYPIPFFNKDIASRMHFRVKESHYDIDNLHYIRSGRISFLLRHDAIFKAHPNQLLDQNQLFKRLRNSQILVHRDEIHLRYVQEVSYFYIMIGVFPDTIIFTNPDVISFNAFNLSFIPSLNNRICPVIPKMATAKSKDVTFRVYDALSWLKRILIATSHGLFLTSAALFESDNVTTIKTAKDLITFSKPILSQCIIRLAMSENFRSPKMSIVALSHEGLNVILWICNPRTECPDGNFNRIAVDLKTGLSNKNSNFISSIDVMDIAVSSNQILIISILININYLKSSFPQESALINVLETKKSFKFTFNILPKERKMQMFSQGFSIVTEITGNFHSRAQFSNAGRGDKLTLSFQATYTKILYPSLTSDRLYLLGNHYAESLDGGQTIIFFDEYPGFESENSNRLPDKENKTESIFVTSFATYGTKGYQAFLNSKNELWFTTLHTDRVVRLRPSNGWNTFENRDCHNIDEGMDIGRYVCLEWYPPEDPQSNVTMTTDNTTTIIWIVPLAVFFDMDGHLYEIVAWARQIPTNPSISPPKSHEFIKVTKRQIRYSALIHASSFGHVSLLNAYSGIGRGRFNKGAGHQRDQAGSGSARAPSLCPYNYIKFTYKNIHTLERKTRYVFRPPRMTHFDEWQSHAAFVNYHALSSYIVNEDIAYQNPYNKKYVSTLEKWILTESPKFVSTMYRYAYVQFLKTENFTKNQSVHVPRYYYTFRDIMNYEAPALVSDKRLPNIIYLDKEDSFEFVMTIYFEELTDIMDLERVEGIEVDYRLSMEGIIDVDSNKTVQLTKGLTEISVRLLCLSEELGYHQHSPGLYLIPVTFSMTIRGSETTCIEETDSRSDHSFTLKGTETMQVMVGCPPKTALVFDWNATRSAIKKYRECPDDDISGNSVIGGIPCLYFHQDFKPHFTVVDYVAGESSPYTGNYTFTIVGGSYHYSGTYSKSPFPRDLHDFVDEEEVRAGRGVHLYTEDERAIYNWQKEMGKILIWTTNLTDGEISYTEIEDVVATQVGDNETIPHMDHPEDESHPNKTRPDSKRTLMPIFNANTWFSIKWLCQPYNPCGNALTSITFPRNPSYYAIIEISNKGLDPDTYCDYTMRFVIHLHGIPFSNNRISWTILLSFISTYSLMFPFYALMVALGAFVIQKVTNYLSADASNDIK